MLRVVESELRHPRAVSVNLCFTLSYRQILGYPAWSEKLRELPYDAHAEHIGHIESLQMYSLIVANGGSVVPIEVVKNFIGGKAQVLIHHGSHFVERPVPGVRAIQENCNVVGVSVPSVQFVLNSVWVARFDRFDHISGNKDMVAQQ